MSSYYRIHSSTEPLETLLDPRRADGWVADDESADSQPLGISCCSSLTGLRDYQTTYLMAVQDDDVLVELTGELSDDDDRDEHASRLIVESYRVVCTGAAWNVVLNAARRFGELVADLDEAGDDGALHDSADDVWTDYLGVHDSEQARELVRSVAL